MAGIEPMPSKSNDWTPLSPCQLGQGGGKQSTSIQCKGFCFISAQPPCHAQPDSRGGGQSTSAPYKTVVSSEESGMSRHSSSQGEHKTKKRMPLSGVDKPTTSAPFKASKLVGRIFRDISPGSRTTSQHDTPILPPVLDWSLAPSKPRLLFASSLVVHAVRLPD
jgi:hypothetical protein